MESVYTRETVRRRSAARASVHGKKRRSGVALARVNAAGYFSSVFARSCSWSYFSGEAFFLSGWRWFAVSFWR